MVKRSRQPVKPRSRAKTIACALDHTPSLSNVRMGSLDEHGQSAGAAPDVEDEVVRLQRCLRDERGQRLLKSEEARDRIVEWQEDGAAGGRERGPCWGPGQT